MIRSLRRFPFRRWLAAFLSVLMALGPIATPSYAALTLLADEPLNVRNASKPNIVLTVDDSTSMLFDFLPDYVINAYCRDGMGKMGALCGEGGMAKDFSAAGYGRFLTPGYVSQQWKVPYGAYNSSYDNSGPGAGCDLSGFPPKCSPGIDPTQGNLVTAGIERYPASSPKANSLYEYWTLWPAPVHNSAFNHLYYNPAVTYDPPVNADGTSFATMNAGNTSNWTRVPADPWATPQVYVDLTGNVMVGQWCNSDWTQGTNPGTGNPYVTDPAFCRTNGRVAPASSGAPAAIGDYMYPWFPTGISANNSPNMALSIANGKVANGGPSAAFLNSADAKYFYENDNVIWCNTASPLWPQGGSTRPQVCVNAQSQTCQGAQTQTCGGGSTQTCSARTQTCNGVTPQTCNNMNAQTCNGSQSQVCNNVRPQTCSNAQTQTCNNIGAQTCVNAQSQTCNGVQAQSCGSIQSQTCNNVRTQSCNGATTQSCINTRSQSCTGSRTQSCQNVQNQSCGNISAQTCNNVQNQTCNGAQGQTCNNIAAQTCNGYQTQSCAFNAQSCNNVQAQTCVNMRPSSVGCTWQYNPPGCETCQGAECGTCSLQQVCPSVGNCSIQTGTVCYSNADCATIAGQCSTTRTACYAGADCAQVGTCSITSASCTSNANCPAISGTCSRDGTTCTSNAQCQNAGSCSVQGNLCYSNANCPTIAGACSVSQASCTSNANCPTIAGTCSRDGASCTANAQCQNTGTCTVQGNLCYSNANCPTIAGTCSATNASCTSNAQCPTVTGTCNRDGNVCSSSSDCPDVGVCSSTNATCYQDSNCPTISGACTVSNAVCTSNAQCPTLAGNCSIDNASCTQNNNCQQIGRCTVNNNLCYSNANCPTISGACSVSNAACTSNANCPTIAGGCNMDGRACTIDADCVNAGRCSVNNNVCTSNANCPTIAGNCSVSNAACTTNANCPTLAGSCSVSGAGCFANSDCPNTNGVCSATGTLCTSNAQCANAGTCSSSGAVCTSNAMCPTLAGSCSITNAACTTNANCGIVAGTCSQTGGACTSVAQCPLVNTVCSIDQTACNINNPQCAIIPGQCSIDRTSCTSNAACGVVPGTCSISGASCTTNAGCPTLSSGSANATCSDYLSDYSKSLLEDAMANGTVCRVNNRDYSGVSASRYNYPDATYNYPVTGGIGVQTLWVDDRVPTGALSAADGGDAWTWVGSPAPKSGTSVHQTNIAAGEHQHYFYNATQTLQVNTGDMLFTWVYLDAANPPSEVMLQWYDSLQGWNFRVYWGANSIAWGTDGTNSRRYMGPLPPTGRWVQLVVPASMIGLEGRTLTGMAFTLYNGRAWWDAAGKAATAVNGGGNPVNACMPSPRYAMVAHHYWKTSVEWCDKSIATAGDKWSGYGTASGGSCQAFKDGTHIYPRFYKYGAVAGTDNYSQAAFERVDLDISQRGSQSFTHTYRDATGTPQTITRTWDDEMTNYANWFAYYRTRIQAVKTVTSLVFNLLDDTYRVGFHTLTNVPTSSFVNIGDFTPGQKASWWTQLFGINIRLSVETPTLDAMVRIGEYYKNGSSGDLSGATDPIVLSCQKNWHMLFTDGFTNQPAVPATRYGNMDDLVPLDLGVAIGGAGTAVAGLTPGQPWPAPFRENSRGASNSASDYATRYWSTDMRTAGGAATNNVPTSDLDPASWQHQNFAAMSLGTEGKLPAGNQSVTEDQLKAGAISWPQVYPNVYRPDESGVDDLWHAAINGRGRFVNAQTTDELKLGMGQILADIANQAGSRAGVAFQSINLSANNKYVYRVRFEPGWGGSLTKVEVNPQTGDEVTEVWRAADQLTQQLLVVPNVKDTPWFTERRIATTDPTGRHVPFLWGNLAATQQVSLSPTATKGQAILEFLRGNRSNEGAKLGNFRVRPSPLGDIVDSSAVFVGVPKAPYDDGNDPAYSTFKSSFGSRPSRVYVAANDGMVHAFDESSGNEAWAYVPLGAYNLATPLVPSRTLGALSYQDGGLPAFRHHFYVDSTPKAVDVDFGAGGGDWRTVLVGGLGKGGKSYYAIDITDPSAFINETEVARKILWEFTDADMGYTYGKPLITKTHAGAWAGASGDKWVAILPAGYNNATGEGKLFFVDVATGQLLLTMGTGSGDAANPSGLAHIAGYTKDFRNYMTEQVYTADLNGNLWRFDISDTSIAKWKVDKIASLTDPGGQPQPVTTPPQIEVDVTNGVDRWVFVGTGKLYHASDLTSTQTQTMYAIRDGTNLQPDKSGRVLRRADLQVVSGINGLPTKPDNGWYDDLPAGQRIIVPPQAALSMVTYSATSPQNDPCVTGQPTNVYAREYARGNSLLLDDDGKTFIETKYELEGGVGLELVALDNATAYDVPNIVVGLTLGTTGKLKPIKVSPPAFFAAHRMSWRLLSE